MVYEKLISFNHRMIMRDEIADTEKQQFVKMLLNRCESHHDIDTGLWKKKDRQMYPQFLLPTIEECQLEQSKKLRLITGELPKTSLLSHNAYELEALRLLALWDIDHDKQEIIMSVTAERLNRHNFCHFFSAGESFALSLVFLRFWNTYRLNDTDRINDILIELDRYIADMERGAKNDIPSFYMWLVLGELAEKSEVAANIIQRNSWMLYTQFQKGWIVNPDNADRYNPIRKYVLRNALSKLPEFIHMNDAEIFIDTDRRCYGRDYK